MNVLVAVDAQLFKTPDGKIWSKTIYSYDFWRRYLDVFETITIVSRMQNIGFKEARGYLRSDGDRVNFKPLPMAKNSMQYIFKLPLFIYAAKKAIKEEKCAIIRLPSISMTLVELFFRTTGKPYAIEVVVDPKNAFEKNKIVASALSNHLKRACKEANGVSYVTKTALQEKYPCKLKIKKKERALRFETYYSSITLTKEYFCGPRYYTGKGRKIRLIHTANNVKNRIKGHDVVIKIVKKLNDLGIDAEIIFVGDGKRRKELEKMAELLGIGEKVLFTGLLSSPLKVREKLMEADMFVFPTKCEGLPRAIIESMAVGLPCLSTPVNGIPELLEPEFMFDPLDVNGFTNKIVELINNPEKMYSMSAKNIEKAKEYAYPIIRERRIEFYTKLKNISA